MSPAPVADLSEHRINHSVREDDAMVGGVRSIQEYNAATCRGMHPGSGLEPDIEASPIQPIQNLVDLLPDRLKAAAKVDLI